LKEETTNLSKKLKEERAERLNIEKNYKSAQAILNYEIQKLRSNLESANTRQRIFQQLKSICQIL